MSKTILRVTAEELFVEDIGINEQILNRAKGRYNHKLVFSVYAPSSERPGEHFNTILEVKFGEKREGHDTYMVNDREYGYRYDFPVSAGSNTLYNGPVDKHLSPRFSATLVIETREHSLNRTLVKTLKELPGNLPGSSLVGWGASALTDVLLGADSDGKNSYSIGIGSGTIDFRTEGNRTEESKDIDLSLTANVNVAFSDSIFNDYEHLVKGFRKGLLRCKYRWDTLA